MSHDIGVEIGARRIRAVAIGRRRQREAVELDWDGTTLAEAMAALRARLGSSGTVALAVAPEWLFVKRVSLPPVSADERRRILALEPERFFPVRGDPLVVAARQSDDLVFAGRQAQIEDWVAAAGRLGSVARVEPSPVSLARACAAAGVATGAVIAVGSAGQAACVRFTDGRVVSVRRVRGSAADAAACLTPDRPDTVLLTPWSDEAGDAVRARLPGTDVRPVPSADGLTPDFACAHGAALGIGGAEEDGLVPPALAQRLARRHRNRTMAAVAAVVAAGVFFLGSLDASRARAAARVDAELARLRAATADIVALQSEALRLEAGLRTLDTIAARRPDPLALLLEISRRLPADAFLRGLGGAANDEWELDGYARNAAGLIPTLEASPVLADVRFRAATTRLRIGNQDYESFALALRRVPAP